MSEPTKPCFEPTIAIFVLVQWERFTGQPEKGVGSIAAFVGSKWAFVGSVLVHLRAHKYNKYIHLY
ncbi:hypothetical protein [Citrobacter freundii]|uniref:hypothetical protein n=1 Tax=Citrobacter freundii TaxID=546 RepID=UPI00333A471C